ncbi:MAG: FprA family A-type flavoprotein [Bacteroidales bacterium]|nr:FprA family A-type flavoprotein [Bacteroidales bacterium]
MYCTKQINENVFWIGGSDRRLAQFENIYPIPRGVSYNSFIILDEKNVIVDAVDKSISSLFFENIKHIINDGTVDYLIVNHMEPDHCATIGELVLLYPDIKIVGNAKTMTMIKQFFDFDIDSRSIVVKEGDTLSIGKRTLSFMMAPMVHWPEVMVTYDSTDKTLYSADAFGTFGAINGNIYADEVDFKTDWLPDARRYYTNIVGKYGTQVQSLLKKISSLDVKIICPLHGPIWRKDLDWFIEKYNRWSTYTPEINGVLVIYGSIYGGIENLANIIASKLADNGISNIAMYDVSATHFSDIVSEAFKYSHIVIASSTYNAGIFTNMETVLLDLKAHNLQNRTIAIAENGSWAPTSGGLMENIITSMKNMTIIDKKITIRSTVKEHQLDDINIMVNEIVRSIKAE